VPEDIVAYESLNMIMTGFCSGIEAGRVDYQRHAKKDSKAIFSFY
jgi:hypothetical protein